MTDRAVFFFCDLLRKRGRSFCAFSDDSFNICRSIAFGALRYSMVQHIVHNRRGDAAAKEFDKICERSLANPFVGMKLADHTCFDVKGSWFACMICPFRRTLHDTFGGGTPSRCDPRSLSQLPRVDSFASNYKCLASSNKCLTSSNNVCYLKLV